MKFIKRLFSSKKTKLEQQNNLCNLLDQYQQKAVSQIGGITK